MKYRTQTLNKYLNDLSAKLPAPGGGSAAAFNAAMAVSLISMVVNFTLGKPKYALFQKELKKILAASEKLRRSFLELVDRDIAAYESKDLRKATAVPLEVARLSCQATKLCLPLIKKGNVNLISDIAVAAVSLESAFMSACFNVEINLKSLKDKNFKQKISKELARMKKIVQKNRKDTEVGVGKIIRG